VSSISGFLGLKWGDDPHDAARLLGLSCEESWAPWEGGHGYETCFETVHHVDAFSRKAYVRLFRNQNGLQGLSLRFVQCAATRDPLAAAIRQEFGLEEGEGNPYSIFSDRSVVHLGYDSGDDTCTLTIAGPEFGKAFADYLLRQGFADLSYGLRPH
jgi:hypothetical protein